MIGIFFILLYNILKEITVYWRKNMLESNDKYFELLNEIKETLIVTRNKIVENVNKELILTIL